MLVTETQFPSSEALAQRLNDLAGLSRRVAHDFDNILTGIVGFAELSLAQLETSSAPHRYLSDLLRVCEQGIQLTQRLHYFHRCGTARPGSTELPRILREEVERLRHEQPVSLEVDVQIANALPPIAIESEPVRQVVGQILTNAAEAVQGSGRIEMRAQMIHVDAAETGSWIGAVGDGPYVEIRVVDNGAGIPAELRQRLIVEPFFTTKPRHRGLGLPIAFRILHAHRGGLQLDASPAGGCSVRVALPTAASGE